MYVGLKPVSGVAQVTIKRKKNSIFVISRPDVYVNSSNETYIVFGEARVRSVSYDDLLFTAVKQISMSARNCDNSYVKIAFSFQLLDVTLCDARRLSVN